jgi:hypothetical protein
MNILVLTSEPISARQLREAVSAPLDAEDAQVMVVAPALQESPLKFWFSDADEAIARADAVRRETVAKLDDAGVPASGDTGESDPFEAIDDALRTFPADRIVVFTHTGEGKRYREDVDAAELQERYGIPVDRAAVTA